MMKDKLSDSFKEYRPTAEGGYPPVLVALSGGADSVTLFHLTASLCERNGGYFYACHVNHGIRGEEAVRDRDFCVELANNCPYCRDILVLNADVPAMCRQSGRSLELEARLCRYGFFESVMKEHNIKTLVTAHNADDNLETLIFNLVRGSGVRGMCGIPPIRELSEGRQVLRPLLSVTKAEILDFCRENAYPFVTDSTNLDSDYSRNLIRNEVIPILEGINPSLRRSAARLSESMREVAAFMDSQAEAISDGDGLDLDDVNRADPALLPFLFSRGLSDAGYDVKLERIHVNALADLCRRGRDRSSVSLPEALSGRIREGRLIFLPDPKGEETSADFELTLTEGENLLPDGSRLTLSDQAEPDGDVTTKLFLGREATIVARNRREGDRIRVKGVNKSLKKLMCDLKIPRHLRDRLPVILIDGEIVAAMGVAVADPHFTKGDADRVLTLKIKK